MFQSIDPIYVASGVAVGALVGFTGVEDVAPQLLKVMPGIAVRFPIPTQNIANVADTLTSGSPLAVDTPSFSEAYASKNAGTGLTLIPAGVVADGNGGLNYAYTFVPVSTGEIDQVALTITAWGEDSTASPSRVDVTSS